MPTGPLDPATAGSGRFRAGHADRGQVIETLKDAFVQGRLTRDELGTRAGRALAARTFADLAALTADIPPVPAPTRPLAACPARPPASAGTSPARPPVPARRRPLARAAAGSGGCLVIAVAAVRVVGLVAYAMPDRLLPSGVACVRGADLHVSSWLRPCSRLKPLPAETPQPVHKAHPHVGRVIPVSGSGSGRCAGELVRGTGGSARRSLRVRRR